MSHHNTFQAKGIQAPGFQERLNRLHMAWTTEPTDHLSGDSVLGFLFDDLPLPEVEASLGDGGRAEIDGQTSVRWIEEEE